MSTHPVFGRRSLDALATCHPRLVDLARLTIRVGMDFAVIEGWRGQKEQDGAVARGTSRVSWPHSKHNHMEDGRALSLAIDVAPYPIDWKDVKRFYHLAGIWRAVAFDRGILIRWGGDWDGDFVLDDQTLFDLGHFELISPLSDSSSVRIGEQGEENTMDFLTKLFDLLNGRKSYLGLALIMMAWALGPESPEPRIAVLSADVVDKMTWAGVWLGGGGLIHKLAKLAQR